MRKEEFIYLEKICETGVHTFFINFTNIKQRNRSVVITIKLVTFFISWDNICYFK